jgi:hypothetical protein
MIGYTRHNTTFTQRWMRIIVLSIKNYILKLVLWQTTTHISLIIIPRWVLPYLYIPRFLPHITWLLTQYTRTHTHEQVTFDHTTQVQLLSRDARITTAPPHALAKSQPIKRPLTTASRRQLVFNQRTRYRPPPPKRSCRGCRNFCPSNQFKKSVFVPLLLPLYVFHIPTGLFYEITGGTSLERYLSNFWNTYSSDGNDIGLYLNSRTCLPEDENWVQLGT